MRALDLLAEGAPDSQVAITINVDRADHLSLAKASGFFIASCIG